MRKIEIAIVRACLTIALIVTVASCYYLYSHSMTRELISYSALLIVAIIFMCVSERYIWSLKRRGLIFDKLN